MGKEALYGQGISLSLGRLVGLSVCLSVGRVKCFSSPKIAFPFDGRDGCETILPV